MSGELAEATLKTLICPECKEYIYPPINQCHTGHIFCNPCFKKMKRCAQCSAPKSKSRLYILERIHNLLTFECKYNSDGCQYKNLSKEVTSHQQSCEFATILCPTMGNCKWSGSADDVMNHYFEKHPTNICKNQTCRCISEVYMEEEVKYGFVICESDGYVFKIFWKIDFGARCMLWSAYNLGHNKCIDNYEYSVVLGSLRNEDKIKFTRNFTHCTKDGPEDIFNDENRAEIYFNSDKELSKYFTKDEAFLCNLIIMKKVDDGFGDENFDDDEFDDTLSV